MARKALLLVVLCGLVAATTVSGDGSESEGGSIEDAVVAEVENEGEEAAEDKLHKFFDDSHNKFMMAVYNLSDYLPLSVEYAAGVGQECDIVEYNRSYYSRAGLITSSIMAILGIVFAFFGYRLMKIVLFLIGFVFGGALTYFIVLAFTHDLGGDWVPYTAGGAALVVGVICGVLTICIYYIGIFLSGAGIGFLLTWFVLAAINIQYFQTHIWVPFIAALVGAVIVGVVTLFVQKWFFMLGTAILGGFEIVWSIDYVLELGAMVYYLFLFAENRGDLKPCWYSWSIIPLFVIVALTGFLVQAIVTGRKYDHRKHFNGICCGACRTKTTTRGGKVYMEMKDPAVDE